MGEDVRTPLPLIYPVSRLSLEHKTLAGSVLILSYSERTLTKLILMSSETTPYTYLFVYFQSWY